ncbi:hypothetical protein HHL22_10675 [Hymenobacter sp. RP-2-7]|uniref:Uncharacterized protein n=1 Tax=Hymenobacter polaris TaxID=2682546 RepID=A0A7Y0FMB1_9BACT|nr:hypothetical protein [Hymenobacter polaris]NML65668.1 hypothetical protein [Hymenobacter polaris]
MLHFTPARPRYYCFGWLLGVALGLPAAVRGQAMTVPAEYGPLLERLAKDEVDRHGNQLPWPAPPVLHRDSTYASGGKRRELRFEVVLGKPLGLTHRVVQLRGHGYPVSYSVLFQGCLVALFRSGKFGCYRLADFTPDEQLQQQLNNGTWERHWLIEGLLVAQNAKGYYAYNPQKRGWKPCKRPVPFGKQPKLYEDARYLAYATCGGEFGGTAYFYNKQTNQTHCVSATCATSIWQEDGQYRLLASLGHMEGDARCAVIADPEVLPLAATKNTAAADWQYNFRQPEPGVVKVFDFFRVQLFGALRYQQRIIYLMHWHRTTFLAAIDGQRITIVDPLFADDLYTFNPVTITYGPNLALTNLNSNDLPETSEAAALLWQGQQVTKVEWGEQPAEMK